ncbi:TonB-dependent siderophore receptor, partial [Steroidobacter sp.]|uniref:TonB-dependent siderophore receptor n=1 Tax=Steroidobacter sp. TaxID=1978227 RepID=UPI001A49426F
EPAFTQNPFIAYPINEQSQRGIYATVGLQLAEPLRLTLGGRQGKYNYHQESRNATTGARSVVRYEDDAFIPSAALNYTLSDQWTAYFSFGETFKPQADLLAPPYPGNGRLDPVTGDNLELGVKGEIFERVNAAVAIYQLKRNGQGALDTSSQSASNPADGSRCCYIPVGEIKVQGADLEMSGAVLPDWQVFGGYTYTKTDFEGNPTGVRTLGRTPEHQVKIWSTWRLPGSWNAMTLNAGVIAQSSTVFDTVHFGGYTVWNASVQYRVSDHWSLAVSGDNLTDKVYYLPTGTLYNQNVYGTPRALSFSVRGNW